MSNNKIESTFESLKRENGHYYWWASDLGSMLGYQDLTSFKKVINRAIKACLTLNINHNENFHEVKRTVNGKEISDYKLSRFACYLTVMNGDPKKEAVALAQVYFVEQTRKFELYIQNHEEFERLAIRDELIEGNKSLNSTAKSSGLTDYASFYHKGYLGLYNMSNWQLAERRKVEKNKLQDYMGRTELAANLFRVTQTEEKIKHQNIKGQTSLENTHYMVGREVRKLVIKNTGKPPEALPVERKMPDIKKELKAGYRKMLKEDKKKI